MSGSAAAGRNRARAAEAAAHSAAAAAASLPPPPSGVELQLLAGLAALQQQAAALTQALSAQQAAAATREAAAAEERRALLVMVEELRRDVRLRQPVESSARLADVLPYVAAMGYVREAGAAAATSRETWTTVPPGLSEEQQTRVRRDGLLWQVFVKARYRSPYDDDDDDDDSEDDDSEDDDSFIGLGWTRLMWAACKGAHR